MSRSRRQGRWRTVGSPLSGLVAVGLTVVAVNSGGALAVSTEQPAPSSTSSPTGPTPTGTATKSPAYHVAPDGDDAADGSAAHPWRTIAAAVAAAPAYARIVVAAGDYGPFTVTRRGQRIVAPRGQQVVVHGAAGVRDVVRLAASRVTLSGVTVTGCVPEPSPSGPLEDVGSSDVRIDDTTQGVTVHRVTVTDSEGTNAEGLPVGCYGVFAHHADAFRVVGSDLSGAGIGVYVEGGGRGAVIAADRIHDNHVLIRDTPGGDDDFGAVGVFLSDIDASPGPLVTRNTVTRNAGPSADYGTDGGAFEIFNASHSRFVANTAADNAGVLETGSSPGGGCVDDEFSGNRARGRTAHSALPWSTGLLLRCASNMQITGNTLSGLDWWTFSITTGDRFSTDVDGLRIAGNTVNTDVPAFRLAVDPAASGLVMGDNTVDGAAESGG